MTRLRRRFSRWVQSRALPGLTPGPYAAEPWNLHEEGRFAPRAPAGGVTIYLDPAGPTPAVGGPSLLPDSGPVDNAAHESRSDVAVFRATP